MAAVVLRENSNLSFAELLYYCQPRMPYFAVPRYLEFVTSLPMTTNGKVTKFELQERGVTEMTWDREKVGIRGRTLRQQTRRRQSIPASGFIEAGGREPRGKIFVRKNRL